MPKTTERFDPALYAPVAERIRRFFEAFPDGRIDTQLWSRTASDVVFKASVFRSSSVNVAAATGWAAEREGDGDVNTVACLENTETSAIGRALANLGFTAARERPSAEEMAKAERVRTRMRASSAMSTTAAPTRPAVLSLHEPVGDPYGLSDPPLQTHANALLDLLRLIERARAHGLRPARAAAWREALTRAHPAHELVARYEERLREWITRE
ncbi:MAG: hypothetical protein H0W68_06065 [Gemmatimonadaceae bacterium]|nr:hypothetical protein [Gemmatimonadaceae bacterium]